MSTLRFSRRTVIAALEMLDRLDEIELTRFLLKLSPNLSSAVKSERVSVPQCINNLIKHLDIWPDEELPDGGLLRDALVDKAISLIPPPVESLPSWVKIEPEPPPADIEAFRRALEMDGFVVSDGSLRRMLPADVGLPTAENETTRLLDKYELATPKGHLTQALDAHGRGDWAAANSQIRTFFDALLDELAERLEPTANALPSGQSRRAKLAALGFLSRHLNEWDDKGTGFINGLVKRLHPAGAHPGLSDQEDSTFRLHVVLLTTRLLLARFDALSVK